MLQKLPVLLLLFILPFACNQKEDKPATALDTGRAFIRASLDGDFEAAEKFLLKDTLNTQLFASYKRLFNRLPAEKKKNYRSASYTINKYLDVDDSTTIINYSNSYMNKPMEIKVVRLNKEWSIDFKYISSGNLPID
jgi:hypothetical protein